MRDYIVTFRVGAGMPVHKRLSAVNWYKAKAQAVGFGLELERKGELPHLWEVARVEEAKEPPAPKGEKRWYLAVYDYGYGVRSTRSIEAHSLEEAKGLAIHDEDTNRWLVSVVLKHPEGDGVSRR